jgi:hypothetical protein
MLVLAVSMIGFLFEEFINPRLQKESDHVAVAEEAVTPLTQRQS